MSQKIYPRVTPEEWEAVMKKLPVDAMEWKIHVPKSAYWNPSLLFPDVETIPVETLRKAQQHGYTFKWSVGDLLKWKDMKVTNLESYLAKNKPVNTPREIITGLFAMTATAVGLKMLQWKGMAQREAFWENYYNQDWEFHNLGFDEE